MRNRNNSINIYKLVGLLIFTILMSSINAYITAFVYTFFIYYATKSNINSIKSIIIAFTIFFLNPGIVKINTLIQFLRWILLITSLCIIIKNKNLYRKQNHIFIIIGFIWVIYNMCTSFFNSADILTSTLKIISFSMSFFIIVSSIDTKEYDWMLWTLGYYTTLILLSIPLLFSPIGKLRNGEFFQGIWNHPNGFAVMLSILCILSMYMLSSKRYNRYRMIIIFNLIISVLMLIKTESRTGIISFLVVSIVFFILDIKEKIFRGIKIKGILIFLALTIILTIILVLYKDFISDYLNNMIYKGAEGDLLYSSKEILDTLWEDIKRKPIFGNGFGVNSEINESIGVFKMSSPVEKRNIILAILSESGIIGFTIFSIVIFSMTHILSRKKFLREIDSLLVVLLMVNMSEMMFFSANGIGIFIYFILGIYKSEICNSNIIEKEIQEFEESVIYN